LTDQFQFGGHPFVGRDDLVESIGDLSGQPGQVTAQTNREIANAHRLERLEQRVQIERGGTGSAGPVVDT
jgi:hypothetical protein